MDYDNNNEDVVVKHEHHHYHHHTVNNNGNNGHNFNNGNNGHQYNQPHIAFGGYNSPQFRNGDGSVQASNDEANINLELLEQNNVKKRKAVSENVEELSKSSDKSSGFKFPQSRDIKLQRKRRSPDDDLNATPKKPEQIQSVRIYAPSKTNTWNKTQFSTLWAFTFDKQQSAFLLYEPFLICRGNLDPTALDHQPVEDQEADTCAANLEW